MFNLKFKISSSVIFLLWMAICNSNLLSAQTYVGVSATPVLLGDWAGSYAGLLGIRAKTFIPNEKLSKYAISAGFSTNPSESDVRNVVLELGIVRECKVSDKFSVLLGADLIYFREHLSLILNSEPKNHYNNQFGFKPSLTLSLKVVEKFRLQILVQQFHNKGFTIGPALNCNIF